MGRAGLSLCQSSAILKLVTYAFARLQTPPDCVVGVENTLNDCFLDKRGALVLLGARGLDNSGRRRAQLALEGNDLVRSSLAVTQELVTAKLVLAARINEDIIPGDSFDRLDAGIPELHRVDVKQ